MLKIDTYTAMAFTKDKTSVFSFESCEVFESPHGHIFKNAFGEYYLFTDEEFKNFKNGITQVPNKGARLLG